MHAPRVSTTQTATAATISLLPPSYLCATASSLEGKPGAVFAPVDESDRDPFPRWHQLHQPPHSTSLVATTDHLLSRHANHAEALLSKLRISPLSLSGTTARTSFPGFDHSAVAQDDDTYRMTSPFASPPPPYSPQHPHVILDHEKLPSVMADLPPQLPSDSPKPRGLRGKDGDIFHLAPSAALTLLARYVELLVSMTGDVPPTPPPSNPTTPRSTSQERRHSEGGYYFYSSPSSIVDGIRIKSPVSPPESESDNMEEEGTSIIHHGGVDDKMHYGTIARKFWCKTAPEVPIEEYLFRYVISHHIMMCLRAQHRNRTPSRSSPDFLSFWFFVFFLVCLIPTAHMPPRPLTKQPLRLTRLTCDVSFRRIHRFCPLSTAVYLAASYYLHRLSITDRIIPLTRLNAHRLVLSALRIAAKTLEDLSYPHSRFAKVGGLSDLDLSRLEVSFCFLMDFELKVDRAMLENHVEILRNSVEAQVMLGKDGLVVARRHSDPA